MSVLYAVALCENRSAMMMETEVQDVTVCVCAESYTILGWHD